MSEGRHIIARAYLKRTPTGYEAPVNIFGFKYWHELTKTENGVLLTVYDGPVADEHKLPGVDESL